MSKLYEKGEIYQITAPDGKIYIGQVRCYTKTKDNKYIEKGILVRWKAYKWYAKKFNTKLSESIRKYGADNFKIKTLLICNVSQMNYYEVKYIRQ
jgi:hypothetical protein